MEARRLERDPALSFPGFLTDPVRRATSAAGKQTATFMTVQRLDSAAASLAEFGRACARHKHDPEVTCVTIAGVGLKAGGRSSTFDLYSFPSLGEMFVVDAKDSHFVCVT